MKKFKEKLNNIKNILDEIAADYVNNVGSVSSDKLDKLKEEVETLVATTNTRFIYKKQKKKLG